ncbi:MAG: hypothetical protein ABSD67_14755 [Terracidiphilus sp.]|jgi:hypothetical protein
MENTLTFQFDVEKSEMQRLYEQNNFEARIDAAVAYEVPRPDAGTRDRLMHECFCCKKRTVRYCDADTGEEIALISHVTPTPPNPRHPYTVICRLRIGNTVYEAAVPKI